MKKVLSKKPEGQPTRGKTASNRLRRVDNFILLYEPTLLKRTAMARSLIHYLLTLATALMHVPRSKAPSVFGGSIQI